MNEELVFTVDLNELEDEDLLPVSMKHTVNYGPGWLVTHLPQPEVGDMVRLYSGDERELYYGRVYLVVSKSNMVVQVDWDTAEVATPAESWSPRKSHLVAARSDAAESQSRVYV